MAKMGGSLKMKLPSGYIDLWDAYNSPIGTMVNVLGTVVDMMPPRPTRTGEEVFTFKLSDPPIQDNLYGEGSITVRWFRKPTEPPFPQINNVGDVVMLKNAKKSNYQGQPMILKSYSLICMVFPEAAIPSVDFSMPYLNNAKHRLHALGGAASVDELTVPVQTYVIALKSAMSLVVEALPKRVVEPSSSSSSSHKRGPQSSQAPAVSKRAKLSNFGPKFSLVRDLQHFQFRDLVVEVVKKFDNQQGACELYVTDYTANKALWYYTPPNEQTEADGERDGDEFGYANPASSRKWKGPYGYLVLKVDVMEPHATHARVFVREGQVVVLKNVKVKVSANSANARLEGNMWRDDRTPEKINIAAQKDQNVSEVAELLHRKADYWAKLAPLIKAVRLEEEKAELENQVMQKMSRNQLRKLEKEKDKARKLKLEQANQEIQSKELPRTARQNAHIRRTDTDRPVLALRWLLDPTGERHVDWAADGRKFQLPFINARMHARVRAVGFEPANLEDFAVLVAPESQVDPNPDSMEDVQSSPRWEWYFTLHLEDALSADAVGGPRDRIAAQVHHEHAQHLFGNDMPDPADLRANPDLLNKLRYKLSILWGDLAECAPGQAPSNVPFECCLQEYGVEVDAGDTETLKRHPFGWIRFYGLFGTTIL